MHRTVIIMLVLFLGGCATTTKTSLPPQEQADLVKINHKTEISDGITIKRFTDFINTLPNRWTVPWSGPPVGQYYFEFYRSRKFIGSFGIAPNFFCRDYGNFFSQPASQEQIETVGRIVGIDLIKQMNERKNARTTP